MKAVVFEKYGPSEVLMVKNVNKPLPRENEILVRVISTSVTPGDTKIRSAQPPIIRLFYGLFKPKRTNVLGMELSGLVEEVGAKVTLFKKGDEIFATSGARLGAYAEYKCLAENATICIKPSNVSFEEAATIPVGGITALHFLQKLGKIKSGDHVLIYGASGSVGTFAVQLAKHFGATVTGVCSTANVGLMKKLKADKVVDYLNEDFTKTTERYNLIFDAVGKISYANCKNILQPKGKFVTVNKGLAKGGAEKLAFLSQLVEEGKLRSIIDKSYSIDQLIEAHKYVEEGHKKGNVVVNI